MPLVARVHDSLLGYTSQRLAFHGDVQLISRAGIDRGCAATAHFDEILSWRVKRKFQERVKARVAPHILAAKERVVVFDE